MSAAPGGSPQDAREAVLGRIRAALADVPGTGADAALPREYRRAGGLDPAARTARFAERVADYRARIVHARPDGVGDAVMACVAEAGGGRYVVPERLPAAWRPARPTVAWLVDDASTPRELAACAGAVTGCALAIADTGTIVLDGGAGQGRRALSLVPDHLVCVVRASQVVETVPEAIGALGARMRSGAAALTFISGPSATSDIELDRVEGVHGPRRLDVVLVDDLVAGAARAGDAGV